MGLVEFIYNKHQLTKQIHHFDTTRNTDDAEILMPVD